MYPKRVAMPDVPPGTELHLADADWRYGPGPLWLRVQRVRRDISGYYDGREVWIDGWRLDPYTGVPVAAVQALVRISALPGRHPIA